MTGSCSSDWKPREVEVEVERVARKDDLIDANSLNCVRALASRVTTLAYVQYTVKLAVYLCPYRVDSDHVSSTSKVRGSPLRPRSLPRQIQPCSYRITFEPHQHEISLSVSVSIALDLAYCYETEA